MSTRARSRSVSAQLAVPVSLVLVAGTAYLLLMASGHVLDPAGFAALTSFYLLSNTVGRGTFAVLELELTRTVPRSRTRGESLAGPVRSVAGGAVLLLVTVLALLLAASPLLAHVLDGPGGVGLLIVAATTLAISSFVRGPLAGDRRYGPFASTLGLESACYLVGAAGLLIAEVGSPFAWMAVLALAPLIGSSAVLTRSIRAAARRIVRIRATNRVGLPALVVGSSLYLFSQMVWNLGPVISTGRSTDTALAAAFAATAVLLRAPVMAFPAVQALLLPRLAADERQTGRGPTTALCLFVVFAGCVWIALSVLVAPWVVRLFFALHESPGPLPVAAVASSVAVGVLVQLTQTRLLAIGQTAAVAVSWAVGAALLVGVALLDPDPVRGAAAGQAMAVVTAFALQVVAVRRRALS